MILQALAEYYDRLSTKTDGGLAQRGYSQEKISYEIVLGNDGSVVQIGNLLDTNGKKPKPRMMSVPQGETRTSGIKPNFLWDKSSYVLGVSKSSKRADKEHESFKTFHLSVLQNTDDPALKALAAFLTNWNPTDFAPPLFSDEMMDTNFVFRLDGTHCHLHDRDAARDLRQKLLDEQTDDDGDDSAKTDKSHALAESMCLISGKTAAPARLHSPIKGVFGAQTSGAHIVSFNQNAFSSYNKSQGENAPISADRVFAYTTALNHLLRAGEDNRQKIRIGDTTIVFWADASGNGSASSTDSADAAEDFFADIFGGAQTDAQGESTARDVLELLRQGRGIKEVDARVRPETRLYVLGLSPNASRLSVRFWLVDRLDSLVSRIVQHANDIELTPLPWKQSPSAYRLVLATTPFREGSKPKIDDAFSILVGDLMRSILTGRPYPRSLLTNTIMRMRADGHLSGIRVALCKAVLAREHRLFKRHPSEEIPVSLDKASTQPGYLLGRLFASLEAAQRAALGQNVNATIRDRYYGAASATPASIFPVLMRNLVNHLAKLRKERPGQAVNLEKQIQEIVAGLPDHFPASLRIEDQGRFAIGYYHQNQSFFTKKTTDAASSDGDEHESQDVNTAGEHA